MSNIPYGYTEDGYKDFQLPDEVYEEDYNFDDEDDSQPDTCPECKSTNTRRSEDDYIVCDDCGYQEVREEEISTCRSCGTRTPNLFLEKGLCPACQPEGL